MFFFSFKKSFQYTTPFETRHFCLQLNCVQLGGHSEPRRADSERDQDGRRDKREIKLELA